MMFVEQIDLWNTIQGIKNRFGLVYIMNYMTCYIINY